MQNTQEKVDLEKTKAKMSQKQERLVQIGINFILGKNGAYMPSNLGSRSIVVVRQTKILQFTKLLKFNSKAPSGCLNGFMVPIALYQ